MRASLLSVCIATAVLCFSCGQAAAQGVVISGDVSGSKALDETNFNFDSPVSRIGVSVSSETFTLMRLT